MSSSLKLDLEDAAPEIVDAVASYEPGTQATITLDIIVNEASELILDARVNSISDIQTTGSTGQDVEVTEDAPPSILVFAKKDGEESEEV